MRRWRCGTTRRRAPAWGYGGSGPAQLALAILLAVTDEATAEQFYQRFKWSVISPISADPRRPYAMKTDAIVGIKVTETFSKASGRLGKRFFTLVGDERVDASMKDQLAARPREWHQGDCSYRRCSNVAADADVTSGERPYRQGRDRLCARLRWPRKTNRASGRSLRLPSGFASW